MHLQHVKLRFFARITEHALKHHRHVTHEINWIVVHHHLPRHIEFFFASRFLFPGRGFHRGGRSLFELHGAHRAHKKGYHTAPSLQTTRVCKNFPLYNPHFSRVSLIAIVETVQVEQTVDYVQAQLAGDSISKSSGVATSALGADENFAVLKRDYVG